MKKEATAAYGVMEEIANTVTHGIGTLAAVIALSLMMSKAMPSLFGMDFAAIVIYGTSLVLLFLCSTLYHGFSHVPTKELLQRFDHSAIFLLIAGTYTPFLMIGLKTTQAHYLLAVLWLIALFGVVAKLFFLQKFARFSLFGYLAMGWLALLVIHDLYKVLPAPAFQLLWLGGLVYTVGAAFYAAERLAYSHAIWHFFVLGGAACHCVAIGVYLIPLA